MKPAPAFATASLLRQLGSLALMGILAVWPWPCSPFAAGPVARAAAQETTDPAVLITTEEVDEHIRTLSSDAMMGRDAFRPEIGLAEDYIARQFREAGLEAFSRFPDYRDRFIFEYRNRREPDAEPVTHELSNVVGYLEGTDPALKDEYIIIGAHHDHLGVRQPRDPPPPGTPIDSIYNGADDNAAGTVAVMALARYFGQTHGNKRSLIFATFTGEEEGLVGSRHLAENLPVDSAKIVCMINFEMIGKPAADGSYSLMMLGPERSTLDEIFEEDLRPESPVQVVGPLEHQVRYYNGSDNVAFDRVGFITTTLASPFSTDDPDYHRPSDEYELLNIDYMTQVIRTVVDITEALVAGEATPEKTVVEGGSTR